MEQLDEWLAAIGRPTFGDDGCRDRAIAAMRAAGVDAVFPLLVGRLVSVDAQVRCDAITGMLFLDAPQAIPAVTGMLADPDPVVRWHASGCLHDFGDARAVPALVRVMRSDPDPQVRGTAAYALGGIGNPAAIPDLLAVLGADNEHDIHGHSPSSCAATALDDILGAHEARTHAGSGLYRMAEWPDPGRRRHLAEELFRRWSDASAEPGVAPDTDR
ncbi:HEAT repeat domain-containing protein [Gemmata sp. JC673]|uniref:HEAT repeat domain-containing protein n=1 Tax=Gemmata algarum TaxID=2975278 RepID=A0ABU5ETV6_9BACT|nr:HEAT repeat domain-containing protein [Gemmata algarum]MDY3558526.1 HEAT repeat domain-containing protein [Gemmata algarum]